MYYRQFPAMLFLFCSAASAGAQSIPDSVSCRADAIYGCKGTACESSFNNNDLSLDFKKGAGSFCLVVFCTEDGKVRFTDIAGGLSGKTHRAFTLSATRTNQGKRQAFLFQGIVDADGKRFHMIGKDQQMYFGQCSSS